MNLIKVNPNRDLFRPDHDPFRLFDNFFAPFAGLKAVDNELTAPTVDIYDKDGHIVIEAEMPGFDKKDIHIDVKGRRLTLSGERHKDEKTEEGKSYRRERYYGKFERSFTLPYEINTDGIDAHYKNGILTLEISKPKEEKTREIAIN